MNHHLRFGLENISRSIYISVMVLQFGRRISPVRAVFLKMTPGRRFPDDSGLVSGLDFVCEIVCVRVLFLLIHAILF